MNEISNRSLVILLVIFLLVLLGLLGVWRLSVKYNPVETATTTTAYRPLTDAEKATIAAENRTLMLQFASTTKPITLTEMQKEQAANLKLMEQFSSDSAAISIKEGKDNYDLMMQFQ